MISPYQLNKINDLIDRYQLDAKLVTRNEIMDLAFSLKPSSPKTGREITFGSYANYIYRDLPSHLTKHDLMMCLAMLICDPSQFPKPENRIGFFTA